MPRLTRLIVLAPFLLVAAAFGQSQPAAYDITPVIRQLSEPGADGYDAALARAKALPAVAIVPIWDTLADNSHSEEIRNDLASALESIYARERATRAAADEAATRQWLTSTSIDIYKKTANNPQVDALVLRAFDDANSNRPEAEKSLKAALEAGSADPLLRYFYISRTHRGRETAADNTRVCVKLLADFGKSDYPAGRRLQANLLYLQCALDVGTPSIITDAKKLELLNGALALLPAYLAEGPSTSQVRQCLDAIYRRALYLKGGMDHQIEALELIDPGVSQAMPGSPLLYALEATAYVESTRYAPTHWNRKGRPEDRQKYQSALDHAQAAAERGWRIDPLNVDCPTLMITVARTKFLDRRTMESWFSRATLADPHNFQAFSNKMDYLSPDWQGSEEDCLAFARFCAKYGNGADRVPTILITYYEILKERSDLRDAYMHNPEVWKDLRIAYETLLADHSRLTSDRKSYLNDRGAYIQAACDCDQWQEAKRLLDLFTPDIGYDNTQWKGAPPELFRKQIETRAAGSSSFPRR